MKSDNSIFLASSFLTSFSLKCFLFSLHIFHLSNAVQNLTGTTRQNGSDTPFAVNFLQNFLIFVTHLVALPVNLRTRWCTTLPLKTCETMQRIEITMRICCLLMMTGCLSCAAKLARRQHGEKYLVHVSAAENWSTALHTTGAQWMFLLTFSSILSSTESGVSDLAQLKI